MKKSIALFIVLISHSVIFSQDVITKKDGIDINAKITEITINEVSYKKFSNLQGPSYTISKNEILMIRYENGEKEIFNLNKNSTSNSVKIDGKNPAKFGTYIEGFGNAFYGSFNVEAIILNNSKFKLATRAGIGITPDLIYYIDMGSDPFYLFSWESFPVGINSILFEGNNHMEIGLGGLIYPMGYYTFHPNINIGYRYQKPSKGFLFRAGGTFDFSWLLPWFQLSFGYSF
tara:strand:- start:826 stop:1518 length:693 start_codon:yes stop_codon:yes gene_type:complete